MASAKQPTALAAWYARFAAFDVAALFTRTRAPGPPRTVYVHEDLPASYHDHKGKVQHEHVYLTNQVITSKYTIITFIPRNLLEQFRRVANVFFLVIAILQFFPKFSTISPGIAIFPLAFIVVVTAAKDGYEDIKRHQSDQRVNYSTIRALDGDDWKNPNAMQAKAKTFVRGFKRSAASNADIEYDGDGPDLDDEKAGIIGPHWKKIRWEDLKVGDFVKIVEGEPLPADILICSTSEEEDVAFVETKNLDGETNLKSRNAVASLSHLKDAKACANGNNAFRVNCDRPDTDMYRFNANVEVNGAVQPVDLSMTLLRGTVLRNTAWAIGLVLYTGFDTKILLNSGGTPSKRSKVERQMNPQVFINLVILAVLSVVCAIVDAVLEHRYFPLQAPWLYDDIFSDDNPSINGLITLIYSVLTFQILVPISLYISIEVVRTCQAIFIYLDADIRYEKTGQGAICKSWNLADDLGQIEYIFSDKTGTLTQNFMVFRQCSIGGKAYHGDVIPTDTDPVPPIKTSQDKLPSRSPVESTSATASSSSRIEDGLEKRFTPSPSPTAADVVEHFNDSELFKDLEDAVSSDPNPENAQHHRLLNGFFTVLGLCHTVLTSRDPETGRIEYKAQSPDEAALVQAAADCGFVFCGREKEVVSLRTPSSAPDVERYELLNILEFTSARKRMSVVLRKLGDEGARRLFLLTKGADNVVFARLRASERALMDETERHLSEFANEGLRTLTLAYKVISEEDYEEWSHRYHEATVAMDNREEKIEAVSDELEQDLRLLGATAIEDRLQDGVPETIADLKKAGIKIWVATGDKLETAIAIGRSTNLIANDSNIIIIRGSNQEGKRTIYQQMVHAMEQFFPGHSIGEQESKPRSSTSSRDIPLRRLSTSSVASIVGAGNGERPGGFVLVIDGAALLHAFENDLSKDLLLQLSTLCEAVVCCRVSPLQKALIVKLVKDGLGAMCLAIGDGANDVSMIQAADVGVGISGEEGLQAVNSSDYAIGQFRFLKKLLLVHGHWSYARNGTMILNFFYKNIVPVGVLWWFQIYAGWSGYFVFDYIYILLWNTLWTILPVIALGLFDRFLESDVLMNVPQVYHYGRRGTWFGIGQFFVYAIDGVYQSVIIFFFIAYTYLTISSRTDGYDVSMYEYSTVLAIVAAMVANVYAGLTATAWTIPLSISIFFGIVIIWCFTIIYSAISPGFAITSLYGIYYYLFTSAFFWLSLPIVFFVSLIPRTIAKAWKASYAPDDLDIIRSIYKQDPHYDFSNLDSSNLSALRPFALRSTALESTDTVNLRRAKRDSRAPSRVDMATGVTFVDRGFDFAVEENGVAMRRMQSRISEARASGRNLPRKSSKSSVKKGKEALSKVFSLGRSTKRSAIFRSEADT